MIAFDYNQHMILIMYTNARFRSTGTTLDFVQKNMTDENFEKIDIKIVISI